MIKCTNNIIYLFCFPHLVFTFHKHIFKEIIIVLLHLFITNLIHLKDYNAIHQLFTAHNKIQNTTQCLYYKLTVSTLGRVLRIYIKILKDNRLAESRLVVNSRTPVAVSACSNFEVERTIDPAQKQH